ncbi:MAG: VOC family protein [Pseudomonadales bacterium]
MSIFDHLSIGVSDIAKAHYFYDDLLALVGCQVMVKHPQFIAYGTDTVQFLAMLPCNGESQSAGNGVHIALVAAQRQIVDDFYQLALERGGSDAGAPGLRPQYPLPNVYTAFIRDPFGNKLEIIHNGFSI